MRTYLMRKSNTNRTWAVETRSHFGTGYFTIDEIRYFETEKEAYDYKRRKEAEQQ